MSRRGNSLINAIAENFLALLEFELLYLHKFEPIEEFVYELEEYIYSYNKKRIKRKLKGLSPAQYWIQSIRVA